MKFELFIANRLKTGKVENDQSSTPSLNVAVIGMTLAITIMILSITIVCGFKKEISNKIYNLDSHIKIVTSSFSNNENEIKCITDNIENIRIYFSSSFIPAIPTNTFNPPYIQTKVL